MGCIQIIGRCIKIPDCSASCRKFLGPHASGYCDNDGAVVNQARGDTCIDGLGYCNNCDERCKAKHGPSSESSCDRSVGVPLCKCYYECESPPSPPAPPKKCDGGAGICSQRCQGQCCDMNCAQKYIGGHGFCNTLDGRKRLTALHRVNVWANRWWFMRQRE
ncbi:hypothetical protein [Arabidopsis thaliana]|uniref:Defensin-like protein n=1 Tax=Arabidopsis thaliana TaxID=3702 RepID=Q9SZW0_ARATH|nr:hypothetical protein [Arabidopsis thaliana]CAB81000.1 hypothetical protein [Arabidopsis thaliana]